MRVLAKPIRNPNPRNSELYENMRAKHGTEVLEFSGARLFFDSYDILHIHWPDRIFYWKTPVPISLGILWLMLFIANVRRKKVVYTCHNLLPKNEASRFWLRAYFSVLRRGIHGVIVPRNDLSGKVGLLFPNIARQVIPLGILKTSQTRNMAIFEELFEGMQSDYIFIPGIQESTKKTEIAIDNILAQNTDRNVIVVGKFTDKKYLDFLCRRYESDQNVKIFDRFLSEQELAALMFSSHCVVAAQHKGTNSGVALLAVAYGKTCFCATNSLATAVRRDYQTDLVLPLDNLRLYGKFDRSLRQGPVDNSFSMERVASATFDFYSTLLDEGN